MTMSEREKALAGLPYTIMDAELAALRDKARRALYAYNRSDPLDADPSPPILRDILGGLGENVFIETPFRCAYGVNLFLGDGVYMNTGCVILDCGKVEIGAGTMLGPSVHIYTAVHPLDPAARAAHLETTKAITIGRNVWVAGGAILCPGVTLGNNAVVGAGAVVTKDVPANTLVVGNPAQVVKGIAE